MPDRPTTHAHGWQGVIFDLGGVLIDWDPRYLYRSLFDGDEEAAERFLAEVTTADWNARQDAGRPWSEAVEALALVHPERRELIEAYWLRWPEMLGGPIQPTVDLLAELRGAGVRLFALSNWSAETFPIARPRFPFLEWFEAIVISGELGVTKPDPRIYEHLLERHRLKARATVFIDDSEANAAAARALGLTAIRYQDPDQLRRELRSLGMPVSEVRAGRVL
jgi:2-haloacid dehalogenase